MTEFDDKQVSDFFSAVSAWRSAYRHARLSYFAVRSGADVVLISARLNLSLHAFDANKPRFSAGALEAGQWDIPQELMTVEQVIGALVAPEGLSIKDVGRVRLVTTANHDVFVAPPTMLHPEGLDAGNRLSVLSIGGAPWGDLVRQPESDWNLRAADVPYDSVAELCNDYGTGGLRGDRTLLEVVAGTAVEVLARSAVIGRSATLGLWVASSLDRGLSKIGYRALVKGQVVARGTVPGKDLEWVEEDGALVGTVTMPVPLDAVLQCIASYDGHAHQVVWRADPSLLHNPRAAVLSILDPNQQILRSYLRPEAPLRGKAADDFEAAVAWLLWTLGFSTATFGTNPKTRDAFDIVAASPRGDFIVVECTLGLPRAEGKLSRLTARAAGLRSMLDASSMTHLRVVPILVTAMSAEEVKADAPAAEETGVLVLSREALDQSLEELRRFPDADALVNRALVNIREKQTARLRTS
jgi:hypothetical protein